MSFPMDLLKKTVERAFRECFFGCKPTIDGSNCYVFVEEGERRWTVREGEISVKRYREEAHRRRPYMENVTGLILERTDNEEGTIETTTLRESTDYDVPRIVWALLENWATFRIRNYCSQTVVDASKCVTVKKGT